MSVLGFLATLLGGSVLGVLLRAGHERAERTRERLIETAERFLTAREAARDAMSKHRDRTAEEMTARAAHALAERHCDEALKEVEPAGKGPLHSACARVRDPLARTLARLPTRYDEGLNEETRAQLNADVARAREQLDTEAGDLPDPIQAALTNVIDAAELVARRTDAQRGAFGESSGAMYRLIDAHARVMVVFPPQRRLERTGHFLKVITSSPSTVAAGKIVEAYGDVGALISTERAAGRDPGYANKAVSDALVNAEHHIGEFAASTNRAIRRRYWL